MAFPKSQSTNKVGFFTGSFDPFHLGHLDVAKRASQLFDELIIGVMKNDRKNPMFKSHKRAEMIREILQEERMTKVAVMVHDHNLTVNVAKELGATALVRSIRNSQDLVYEQSMIYFNRQMTGIETVLLMARPEWQEISSSRIKELFSYGADISSYVPRQVLRAIEDGSR